MVPRAMRYDLLEAYTPGQERRMDPSEEYLQAALTARAAVAEKEGHA